MSSPAFQKFKSLENRSQSAGRPGLGPIPGPFINERPSPDQGLGSSVSSSTTSLQQPLIKSTDLLEPNKPEQASKMAALKAQFFQEKLSNSSIVKTSDEKESKQTTAENSNSESQNETNGGDVDKNKVLDRQKKNTDESSGNTKLDALAKGNQNDIKSMFEEHIAVRKGLIPDPNLDIGPVVKMRRKVNPNLPTPFKKFEEEEDIIKTKKRESVPIDRKMFKHFLNKFEDDQSRGAAKKQCWKLTQKQKGVNTSWSKKQEEARLLEERKIQEEIAAIEAQAEKERLEKLEEERILKEKEEEELQCKMKEAEEELKAAQEAEEKKKKTKKKVKKKAATTESKELPNLVAKTCSDLKSKYLESLKASKETSNKAPPPDRPKGRKIMDNPFEKQIQSEIPASVKKRELPAPRENRLGDLKKRFSQLISNSESPPTPQKLNTDLASNDIDIKEKNVDVKLHAADTNDQTDSTLSRESKGSPAVSNRISLIQSSVDAVKGSFEKLTNSKEKLSGAFSSKKNKKPSVADMQGYLISHVLYDGQVKMDMEDVPEKKEEEEDDLFAFLKETEEQSYQITDEDLLKDQYLKGLHMYLSVLDDAPKKAKKKQKKKKKSDDPTPALKTQQVSSIKEQFEFKKNNTEPVAETEGEPEQIIVDQKVDKVKSLFESASKATKPQEPEKAVKRQSRMISNHLIQKFDKPEMVDELKKQRDKEREERKQERIRRLEEERKKIEEEMMKAKKIEEERLEKERQEQLRKEESARLELLKKEEEERMKAAYEKMLEEEIKKAEARNAHELQQKAKREQSEPAFKQKKVLGRIQHIFQKKMEEDSSKQTSANIGSVKGMADELFSKKDENLKSPTQTDPTLAGVGGVLESVRNKFENKEEDEPIPLFRGVPMVKKESAAAKAFEEMELKMKNESEVMSPQTPQTEWAWKKKDKAQLAQELNKTEQEGNPKPEKKISSRAKKSADRQRELLEDIQAMNSRLSKRNALKEHEDKMEEYSKFMEEIGDYLVEPDESREESTFKDGIKSFISSKIAHKKPKTKKKMTQPIESKEIESISKSSVAKLKEQLYNSNDVTDGKTFEPTVTGNVNSLKSSLIQQYTASEKVPKQEEEIEISSSVSAMKGIFEVEETGGDTASLEKTKVKKKIVQVPEAQEDETPKHKKNSFEWKYKKKSIQELQNFMSSHNELVPDTVNKAVEVAREVLEESVIHDKSSNDQEEDQIDTYGKMIDEVEHYLCNPDKNKEEIEFKEQIERYLDLVEMPSKEKEKVDDSTLRRKPKKLNMSLYMKGQDDEKYDDSERSPVFLKSKDTKTVKELQNKLFVDNDSPNTPDLLKELVVHTAGTSSLKKGFEKLSKDENVELIPAPKFAPQKFFGDMLNGVSDTKSLEQLKSEGKETTWKWKQNAIGDLHTFMTGHLSHASKAIVESHKNILKADIELQNIQNTAQNTCKVDKITMERNEEMDKFLENVKEYLNEPTKSFIEDSVKTGVMSYLNLIEDGPKGEQTPDQEQGHKFLPSGQVTSMKDQLESQKPIAIPQSTKQIGRLRKPSYVDTTQMQAKTKKHMSKSNSDDIKESLVKKFFVDDKPKDMMKVPKTKLVAPVGLPPPVKQVKAEDSSKPIEAKKQWKPPQPINPSPLEKPKESKTNHSKSKEKEKYVSKYAHITDENEKKAAILAQFGCKPRPAKEDKIDSSSSSDADEDMTNYIENDLMKNNDLYVVYGDRLRAKSPPKQKKKQPDSVDFLKGILGAMRKGESRNDLDSSSDDLSLSESPEKAYAPGSCSNIKARFENNQMNQGSPKTQRYVEKSSSFSNVGKLYEQSMQDKKYQNPTSGSGPRVGKISTSKLPSTHQQDFPDSGSNLRARFEINQINRGRVPSTQRNDSESPKRQRFVEKSSSYSNVGKLYEQSMKDKKHMNPSTRSGQNPGKIIVPDFESTPQQPKRFLPGNHKVAKSASFHKFKQSFEVGEFDSDEDEDDYDDDAKQTDQRSQIQSELDEIRSSSRVQKMFSINKPKNFQVERSSSSSALLDHARGQSCDYDEDVPTVTEARSSIRNIFEASASKITYGGGKSLTEQLREKEKSAEDLQKQPKKQVQFSDRTWVLNTINKYFDVVDEEEEDEDGEGEGVEDGDDDEEVYSDEESEEEDEQVFSTQISAQRVVYPSTSMPPYQATNTTNQQQPSRPPIQATNPITQQLPSRPPIQATNPIAQQNPLVDESLKANLRAKFELSQINRGYTPSTQKQLSQSKYDDMAKKYADEQSEEEDYDDEEDEEGEEYEEELEVEDDDGSPRNFSLLQRSASSSRMKGLFNAVLQKSASGASLNPHLDISQFKANLTRHLQRRESFTGDQNVAQENSESEENDESDEDCFEDCSEVPLETKNFYRLPL